MEELLDSQPGDITIDPIDTPHRQHAVGAVQKLFKIEGK